MRNSTSLTHFCTNHSRKKLMANHHAKVSLINTSKINSHSCHEYNTKLFIIKIICMRHSKSKSQNKPRVKIKSSHKGSPSIILGRQ